MTSVDASPAPAKTSWKTSSKLGFPLGQRSKVPSWQRADQAYAPVMVAIVAAAQISQAAAEAKVPAVRVCLLHQCFLRYGTNKRAQEFSTNVRDLSARQGAGAMLLGQTRSSESSAGEC
jgi:hypothetical protein